MIHGSSDLDCDPDPEAVFLWVTDDPALNRQTRNKMVAASDLLDPGRLIILENDFLDSKLNSGRVYFLNIQKLSKSSGLAQGGNNLRQYSMWEIIGNTIRAEGTHLYLVLDEAHRGMRQATDRKTIVQRIIGGQPDSNPPVPITWGISATIERFTAAMEGAKDRTTYPPVAIDIDKVRASGIIKDQIDLDEPDDSGTVVATLLRTAVDATLECERRWAEYAAAENEPLVLPVLVVQVGDKPTDAQLAQYVSIIEEKWPGLGPHAMVNVFGEHDDLVIGVRKVRWVQPESIQDEDSIRVVLAKAGDLNRVGLPASRSALLRACGEGCHPHCADRRAHGALAAGPEDRHRRRPQLGGLLPAAL
jgi:type III restriction enzyme